MPSERSAARPLAGRYRLVRHIAKGGMADVWLADDESLNRRVAVKLLRSHLVHDETLAERFRREAIACAGINHPNIVAVYDCIEHEGRQAVIMQYVEGKSLREVLDRRRKLGPQLTVHIGVSVAGALDEAHRHQIIHRDVKPGNILITPQGRCLLTDFGIAKALDSQGDDLTHDNVMMGTAKYLSPEQVRGKPLDGRADLYGLGLVLYECLAGRVPFLGETDADTALARLQREPTDLGRLRPSLSPHLVTVIHTLLSRNPDHRYPSGAATRDALLAAGSGHLDRTTEITPPTGTPSRLPPSDSTSATGLLRAPRREWRRLVAALLLLGSLSAAAFWFVARPEVGGGTEVVGGSGTGPIAAVASFDPNGDDGEENESLTPLLLDDDPSTAWTTTCYVNRFFGTKEYVGLVVRLRESVVGTLRLDMVNAPWFIEVYTAQGAPPSALPDWGQPVASRYHDRPRGAEFDVPVAASHLLVLFREVGPSAACSETNPYQGIVSGLSFVQR